MLFPIVGKALVERGVLLWSDFTGVASPERLGLVELLVLNGLLLDSLLLLRLLLLLVFINLLNLRLVLGVFLDLLIVLNLLKLKVNNMFQTQTESVQTFSTSLVTAS